jgi:hypothetical protein
MSSNHDKPPHKNNGRAPEKGAADKDYKLTMKSTTRFVSDADAAQARRQCEQCAAPFTVIKIWHRFCLPCWRFHRVAVARERVVEVRDGR